MRVFKFKPSESIEHAMDIILSDRLYCANPADLNDPMECDMLSMCAPPRKDRADETMKLMKELASQREGVAKALGKLRVCCLSKSMADRLMWAHYADGFCGLAIELDIPDSDIN